MSKITNCFFLFILQAALSAIILPAQTSCPVGNLESGICSTAVQQTCVNECDLNCGDVGPCQFGCQIGGINNADTCESSCTGLGAPCLNACLATVRCVTLGCATNVTSYVALNLGTPVYNRSTGVWQVTVRITNTSGKSLTKLAFAIDTLAAGWSVTNGDGTTSDCGSSYKNFSDLADGATATVTLQLSRAGTPVFTYSPRVIAGASR